MIIEIWGGPKDGQEVEVNDNADHYLVAKPFNARQTWAENDLDVMEPNLEYDTYKIMKYQKGNGMIVKKAVYPGCMP